jgi:hypothetical protein
VVAVLITVAVILLLAVLAEELLELQELLHMQVGLPRQITQAAVVVVVTAYPLKELEAVEALEL